MAIVGHVEASPGVMLEAVSKLDTTSIDAAVVPFVVPRRDGIADCGFARSTWVVELYEWLMQDEGIPVKHQHRIRGLLLGYDVDAIRGYDERTSGRRFTSSP